jgi:hypothetical protein
MEGRPFALLGVNCDNERETLQQVSFTNQITWLNWWNGGAKGPLTAKYGVKSWPTTLVLDANGVVRYRGVPGAAMDQVVEKLVLAEESRGIDKQR